jgi:hypothetical protein
MDTETVPEVDMDEATYQRWWPLHIRSAKGESLTPEELAFYDAGLCQLHREERLQASPAKLDELDEKISRIERENAELASKRLALETQLRRLQARKSSPRATSVGGDK